VRDAGAVVAPARGPQEDGRRNNRAASIRLPDLTGARAVWLPALLTGALFLGLILWQLAIPRSFYTGTNSVGVTSVVASLKTGDRLCVRDLNLPAETARVQLAVFAHRPRFTANIELSTSRLGVHSRMVGVPGPTSLVYANAAIPRQAHSPSSVPATLCITPLDGPIELGGMIGLQGNQVPALLNGVPVSNRVAVWFLPAAGDQRSLLASIGRIFARASLFRPGVVGAWTYPLLLFGLLPCVWALSLILMLRAATGRPLTFRGRVLRPALAIALIAFANAGTWALITPAFNAPDEPDHFAYAQYFAETGHAPGRTAVRPPFSTDETLALWAVDIYSQVSKSDARPPWLGLEQERWQAQRDTVSHPTSDGGGLTPAGSPHQPAYYALLAPAYELVRSESPFSQLTLMRLVSALLGAIVAVCAFGIVRELLPRQRVAAVAAGLLVAFHPMFGFISGAINNDNGVNASAAISLYLLIRGLRRGLTWPAALALGAALAITPFMKESGYEIYPAVAVGLLGIAWRRNPLRNLPAWISFAGAFAFVRGGWSLLQPVFYPAVAGHASNAGGLSASGTLTTALHMPGRFLVYLWELFLPKLSFMGTLFPPGWPFREIYVVRGWGAFGWYVWIFPNWVYLVIILAMALVGVLALSAAAREWVAARRRFWEIAVIALVPVCTLVAVEAVFFAPNGGRIVVAEQGRYIFPAITALAAIAVAGTFGFGRRLQVPLATVLVFAMIGLSYASQWLTLGSFFS
jgi:Predicted membrane protein (DUF2142)